MTPAAETTDRRARAILAARGIFPDPTASTPRAYWGWSARWEDYCCQTAEELLLNLDPGAFRDMCSIARQAESAAGLGEDDEPAR